MDELNRHLLGCCLKERERTVRGRNEPIGVMFEQERQHALELPQRPFDCCIQHIRQADKYQTVLFDGCRYSVPRHVAFEPVTVKAYPGQVVLVHKGQVVARHRRSRTPGEQVLEPMHFLAALEHKPAYLDHTRLFKQLTLPPAFDRLRQRLCQEMDDRTGTRHYIRVLQLLSRHSAERIAQVIERCLEHQTVRADLIEQKLAAADETRSATGTASAGEAMSTSPEPVWEGIADVHVPPPDLRRFDELLIQCSNVKGEQNDVSDAVEPQPQGTSVADDAGGVCTACP